MLFWWASFTSSKEKVDRGWAGLYEFKTAETSNQNVRMHGQRFSSRLSMLKSRATPRECLFMTSTSDETPEASLAPRSTYFKMTFYARSASGQDQTLKTRRIACLFVSMYVLSWKQPRIYSGKKMKKKYLWGNWAAWPVVRGMEAERRVPLTTVSHLSGEQAELLPVDTLVSTLSELSKLRVSYVDSPAGGAWWCRMEWCTMGAPESGKREWEPCGAPQWLCLASVGLILESSHV